MKNVLYWPGKWIVFMTGIQVTLLMYLISFQKVLTLHCEMLRQQPKQSGS